MSIKQMSEMDKDSDFHTNAEQSSLFAESDEMHSLPIRQLFADLSVSEMSEYRRRIRKFENVYLLNGIRRGGWYQMPKANPVNLDKLPDEFVPFNCLKSCKSTNVGVHFFIHDYLFRSVWDNLEATFARLAKYDLVIATDDSVFMDLPLMDNMRNVYKNRVFTAVGQRLGLTVVPSFSCGDPKDVESYCEGLPEGGCIAVGGMGTNRSPALKAIFRYCVSEMVRIKHPDMLLVYGSKADLKLDIPVINIPTYVDKLRQLNRKGGHV